MCRNFCYLAGKKVLSSAKIEGCEVRCSRVNANLVKDPITAFGKPRESKN